MPSDLCIERASIWHLKAIRRIDQSSFELAGMALNSHWRWKHFLRAMLRPYLARVCVVEGHAVGVLVLRIERVFALQRQVEPNAVIVYLAVLPAFRGRGMGTALLQDALQRAKKRGCESVQLEVPAHDERVIQFYQQQGFLKRQRLSGFYRQRHDCRTDGWLMQRDV